MFGRRKKHFEFHPEPFDAEAGERVLGIAAVFMHKQMVQVTLEDPIGTKVGGQRAVLAFGLKMHAPASFDETKDAGVYLGHTISRGTGMRGGPGTRKGACTFSIELNGNGGPELDTGLGILLQACGFMKATKAYRGAWSRATKKAVSIDVWADGVTKGLAGAMGDVERTDGPGGRVMLKFEFYGTWKTPVDESPW